MDGPVLPTAVQALAEERTAFSRGASVNLGRGPIALDKIVRRASMATGLCLGNRGQSEAYPDRALVKAAAVAGFRMSR